MFVTRARDNSCFVAFCNAVGGQDELIFDGHSCVLDDEGEVVARAVGFEETLLVVDVEPNGCDRPAAARRAPPRARARARGDAARAGRCTSATRASPRTERASSAALVHFRARARADAARARARPARLRARRTASRRRDRRLRRDRLGGDRRARRRGARHASACTACRCRRATRPRGRRPTRGGSRRASACDFREISIEPLFEAYTGALREQFAGRRDRPHRGEPPGADPRHAADGALEQVRLARRRHGEQVRALRRLLDALRRPRRRLRADQGRLQDRRLPARAPPERARRPRADPGVDHRAGAERGAAPRPARRGLAAAVLGARQGARGVRGARPLARGALRATASTRSSSSERSR